MNHQKEYEEYIKEIEIIKEKLVIGSTNSCKSKIDEAYSAIQENSNELEVELYKRKKDLLNENSFILNFHYDFFMSFLGGTIGAFIACIFDDILQSITKIIASIRDKTLLKFDPLEISDSGSHILIYFFICFILIYLFLQVKHNVDMKNNEVDIFISDMNEYELKKINELLSKL